MLFRRKSSSEAEDKEFKSESQHIKSIDSFRKADIELEKLRENILSLRETNKLTSERFTHVSEQIGEMRSMILEREKEAHHMEARVLKVIDLVEEVQPENLFKELKKEDAKLEAIKAKLESNMAYTQKHTTELKQLRSQMAVFRGLESVMKLNGEMKENYTKVKKVASVVERHSDRVAGLFTDFQKNSKYFREVSNNMEDMSNSVDNIIKDVTDIKTKSLDFVKKSEFDSFTSDINTRLDYVEQLFKQGEMTELSDYIKTVQALQTTVERLENKVGNFTALKKEVSSEIKVLDRKMLGVTKIQSDTKEIKKDLIKVISGDQAILLKMGKTEKELKDKIKFLEKKFKR
ncbi:MAG: hypothetical protein DRP06_00420 [Candidatus Aenigmatarchaeota archaeon]|nr:MAG: hypothetical protein DRP06_00420 [Candidatus Aenigmarchaeota archaeon]